MGLLSLIVFHAGEQIWLNQTWGRFQIERCCSVRAAQLFRSSGCSGQEANV
jgi:hypothetical protein